MKGHFGWRGRGGEYIGRRGRDRVKFNFKSHFCYPFFTSTYIIHCIFNYSFLIIFSLSNSLTTPPLLHQTITRCNLKLLCNLKNHINHADLIRPSFETISLQINLSIWREREREREREYKKNHRKCFCYQERNQ